MTQNVYPEQGAQTRLALEDAYGEGAASPNWRRLNGLSMMLTPATVVNPFQPKGSFIPEDSTIDDDFTTLEYNGRVDFDGLTYPLYALLGFPVYTNLGGSPEAHQRVWTWDGRRPLRGASFMGQYGFADSAEEALGLIFNSMTISGGRPDGFEVSGNGHGKPMTIEAPAGGVTNEVQTLTETGTITAGNYTVSFRGVTSAAIVHTSNAAAIQGFLEDMAVFEPGDVVVTGGPVSTSPVTLTFGGAYAGQDLELVTVDSTGLTGGTVGVAETTPGADTATSVTARLAGAVTGNAWLDSSWANLGTTELGYALAFSAEIGERLERFTPIKRDKSTDGVIDVAEQEHNLNLTLARNAVGDAQLTKLQNGTLSFPRVDWEADTISGANEYLFRIEACIQYTGRGSPQAIQNALAYEYMGRIQHDPTSGNAWRVTLINTVDNPI